MCVYILYTLLAGLQVKKPCWTTILDVNKGATSRPARPLRWHIQLMGRNSLDRRHLHWCHFHRVKRSSCHRPSLSECQKRMAMWREGQNWLIFFCEASNRLDIWLPLAPAECSVGSIGRWKSQRRLKCSSIGHQQMEVSKGFSWNVGSFKIHGNFHDVHPPAGAPCPRNPHKSCTGDLSSITAARRAKVPARARMKYSRTKAKMAIKAFRLECV